MRENKGTAQAHTIAKVSSIALSNWNGAELHVASVDTSVTVNSTTMRAIAHAKELRWFVNLCAIVGGVGH